MIRLREELAEDIPFVRLGIKKPHFSEKASFRTWLYAVGRNIAVDYTVLPSVISRLNENGIRCERAADADNGLTLAASPEELKNLPLKDVKNWAFDIASDGLKGASGHKTDETGYEIVN